MLERCQTQPADGHSEDHFLVKLGNGDCIQDLARLAQVVQILTNRELVAPKSVLMSISHVLDADSHSQLHCLGALVAE